MLRKTLIFAALIAIAVSPILPTVQADAGSWEDLVSEASWDYDFYRVERLSTHDDMSGPFELGGAVYVTQPAESCKGMACDKVDATIFANAKSMKIEDVNDRITSKSWKTAQDDRFVYHVPSEGEKEWFSAREYVDTDKEVKELVAPEIAQDEITFLTFAADGDRVYTSFLHEDKKTSDVESKLVVHDYENGYERRDFTFTLNAPWQEILDVHEDVVLAKFQFDDGSKQLVLIDERARTAKAVPGSWVPANGILDAAHFTSNGTVQFFLNYRMFTYTQGDEMAVEPGGALLNWFVDKDDAYQVANHRMAWINPEDFLYVSDINGVANFGKVLNKEFSLTNNKIYFHGLDGYVGFDFTSRTWSEHVFLVTDASADVLIGTDANNNVWYQNTNTGRVLNIGFGTSPLMTDREHAIFRGTDGNLYQATFSPLLDLEPREIQAFKAFDEPTVYLVSNDEIWDVPNAQVFYTWFDSFADVQNVSGATLDVYKELYLNKGTAKFAPGTRIKSVDHPRTYVVGQDGGIHWIASEAVADSIWGSNWNKDIVEVRPEALWRYQIGSNVYGKNDIKTI